VGHCFFPLRVGGIDDPDLTASNAIFEMDCSSAHIRNVNVATLASAPQVKRMTNGFSGRSAELLSQTVFGCM
jgi:ATP-dependent Zn protease